MNNTDNVLYFALLVCKTIISSQFVAFITLFSSQWLKSPNIFSNFLIVIDILVGWIMAENMRFGNMCDNNAILTPNDP